MRARSLSWRRWWLRCGPLLAALAVLAGLSLLVLLQPEQEARHQELRNLRFAETASFGRALEAYKPTRPPLYPALLWLTARTGLPVVSANLGLLAATLVLTWCVARRWIRGVRPWVPALLFAALQVNVLMASRFMPENLFTPLALLAFLLVQCGTSEATPRWRGALGQGLVLALGCTTRLFGLFWLLPLAGWHLLLDRRTTLRSRVARTAAFGAVALVPVALWCLHAKDETGYWSGQDRLRTRPNLGGIEGGWASFVEQASQLGKVVSIDLASPHSWARHSVANAPYVYGPVELALLWLLGVALASGVWHGLRCRELPAQADPDAEAAGRGVRLLLEFVGLYVVMTLLLWTFGNNDRLYTRFLYPVYPFLVLLAVAAYARVQRAAGSVLARLPYLGLYLGVLAVQVGRTWYLQATG